MNIGGQTSNARKKHAVLFAILGVHVTLLIWGAYVHSPAYDEWWHLPSGVNAWREGRRDLYRMNPPLVRLVAALPVLPLVPADQWEVPPSEGSNRSEVPAGVHFSLRYEKQVGWWTTLARWACIPFSILGAVVCYRWAGELYGPSAGLVAAVLWCFCPNILAHAQMITPDAGAAAFGVAAAYVFWKWLNQPTWAGVIVAGTVLGLVLLTKLTWIIMLAIWPVLWLLWVSRDMISGTGRIRIVAPQLAAILLLGLVVLSAGYEFNGVLRRLDSFEFVSKSFRGEPSAETGAEWPTNRFRNTLFGSLPVPLPTDYLLGIDRAKLDFDRGWLSYLRGQWSERGWWYYYLYAAAIKVPLGTWLLGLFALLLTLTNRTYRSWNDIAIVFPGIALFAFVSAETGFSHHLRYVLPAFPFAFIWCSKVAQSIDLRERFVAIIGGLALAWSVISSLAVVPHSLSYFNELVGGPKQGHWHLNSSNTDWGQDVFFLQRWYDAHPEARPLLVATDFVVNPRIIETSFRSPPLDPRATSTSSRDRGPLPGWYAISVNRLHSQSHSYDYFLEFEPVDWIGYSMAVYHLTAEDCKQVRDKLELPPLAEAAL